MTSCLNYPHVSEAKRFFSISHDLEQAIGRHEASVTDCIPQQSIIAPVHCDNYLDWIECYYRDIPLLQAQVRCLAAQMLYWNEITLN
jgi:hypothetical protein